MAWADWSNAVEIPDTAGTRFNAATGRNYLAQYGEYSMGGPIVAAGEPTWYISFEPHANRSNEGAFVRHNSAGKPVSIDSFAPRNKDFRNWLIAVASMGAGAAAYGAMSAGAGATGGVTGASAAGGSGAFLGEGALSGVASWDAALSGASTVASSAASTVGGTLKSLYSSVSGLVKPAMGLASALSGGGQENPQYVPFDQPADTGTNPLLWLGVAAAGLYFLTAR